MVIAGSSAPDFVSPADACNVAAALGLEVPAFDVNSACTSLLVQIHLLSLMDPEKLPAFVLLVAPDSLTKTVDYSDRSAAVLWGDARGRGRGLDARPGSRAPARQHARLAPLRPATRWWSRARATSRRRAARCRPSRSRRARAATSACARASRATSARSTSSATRRTCACSKPCASAATSTASATTANVEWFGNTGAASSASVLSMNWEKWGPRDDVAVVGVGAGLTWSSYLVRFGDAA